MDSKLVADVKQKFGVGKLVRRRHRKISTCRIGQFIDFAGVGSEPDGNRWNDCHYTNACKQAARAARP